MLILLALLAGCRFGAYDLVGVEASDAGGTPPDAGSGPDAGDPGTLCGAEDPVDWGTLDLRVDTAAEQTLVLTSCDGLPVRITELSFGAHAGFTLADAPTLPHVLAGDGTLDLRVVFTPTITGAADTDLLVLHDGRLTRVGLSAHVVRTCAPEETPQLSLAVTDMNTGHAVERGSARNTREPVNLAPVRTGPAAAVTWTLVEGPARARLELGGDDTTRILYPELAGDYVVEAIARTDAGCASEPARFAMRATPPERVVVELTWNDGPSDVDVHYVGPGGTLFDGGDPELHDGTDAFAASARQDWGPGGATDQDLVSDNDPDVSPVSWSGPGPEVMRHPLPELGRYGVWVHHFCSREFDDAPSSGPVQATLRVWLDRALAADVTRTLTQRDLWSVGTVVVTAPGIGWEPSNTAPSKTTAAEQGCSPHTD